MTTNETIESLKEYAIRNSMYVNDSKVFDIIKDAMICNPYNILNMDEASLALNKTKQVIEELYSKSHNREERAKIFVNKVIDSAYNAKLMDLDDYFATLIMINQLMIHIMVSLGWILK